MVMANFVNGLNIRIPHTVSTEKNATFAYRNMSPVLAYWGSQNMFAIDQKTVNANKHESSERTQF